MRRQGSAARLTIVVDANDQWHHQPLYVEIIHRARSEGLAGATALRGLAGFAHLSPIHTARAFTLREHLPIVITIVDDHARLHTFLYLLDEILHRGVVLLDDVEVIRYDREPRDRRHQRGFSRHG